MTARILKITLLFIAFLVALGCGDKPKMVGPESTLWNGDVEIDPAGDYDKLQGQWDIVEKGEDPIFFTDIILTIKGHVATFDHPKIRETGQEPNYEKYRFILNSDRTPRAIRLTEKLEPGKPFSIRWDHPEYNRRYQLEKGILTMWTYWADIGEQPKYQFKRSRTSK